MGVTFLLFCLFLHVLLQHLIDGEPMLGGFLSMAFHGIIQTHGPAAETWKERPRRHLRKPIQTSETTEAEAKYSLFFPPKWRWRSSQSAASERMLWSGLQLTYYINSEETNYPKTISLQPKFRRGSDKCITYFSSSLRQRMTI